MTARTNPLVAERLGAYRRFRRALAVLVTLLAASIVVACFIPAPSSDLGKFDQKRWTAARVLDGDTFQLADRDKTMVALLGVDAPESPDAHFAEQSFAYLRGRIEGKIVLLKLDGTQSRDTAGRLLAYVYLDDTDLLNADMIRDGRAYSDRRVKHTFRPQFDQTENEARSKARGLWDEIRDDRMPEWRRRWLQSLNDRQ